MTKLDNLNIEVIHAYDHESFAKFGVLSYLTKEQFKIVWGSGDRSGIAGIEREVTNEIKRYNNLLSRLTKNMKHLIDEVAKCPEPPYQLEGKAVLRTASKLAERGVLVIESRLVAPSVVVASEYAHYARLTAEAINRRESGKLPYRRSHL